MGRRRTEYFRPPLAFARPACYTEGMITDIHTHSTFSADGRSPLPKMLARAAELGAAYYGVSEHFDYDYEADGVLAEGKQVPLIDAEAYFPAARALQREYAPRMRVLVGGEFGYTPTQSAIDRYLTIIETFRPDFVVNSVHTVDGFDPWYAEYFAGKTRREAYARYLERVRASLDAPYPYDIVAHIGYVGRNAPYPAPTALRYEECPELLDDILRTIVKKGKILEVNSSARQAGDFLPGTDILARYFALGGRKVSFASDAHGVEQICARRDIVCAALKAIGFTHITVPDCGREIFVPL